jgi:hypothetical protein
MQKILGPRKLEYIHEYHFVEWKHQGREPDKNSRLALRFALRVKKVSGFLEKPLEIAIMFFS